MIHGSLLEKYRGHEIYYVPQSATFTVYKGSLEMGCFETPVLAKKKIDLLARAANKLKAENVTAFYRDRWGRNEEGYRLVKVLSIGESFAYIKDGSFRSKVSHYELFANTPRNKEIFDFIKKLETEKEAMEEKIKRLEDNRAPLIPVKEEAKP